MTVGYSITAADVNNMAGRLVVALWTALDDVTTFKAWLDDATHDDAFLNGLGITGSASTGDVKTLRDSFADLKKLRDIAHAAATQSLANDFFFSAKKLSGITFAA